VKILSHRNARTDLAEMVDFIASDNPDAAWRVRDAIEAHADILRRHPEAGRPGRVRGTRELVISGTPYIVGYRIAGKTITILRVLHGAQRWPKRL